MRPFSKPGPLGQELLAEARRTQRVRCNFGEVKARNDLYVKGSKRTGAAKNKRESGRNQWAQQKLGSIDANRVSKQKGKKSSRSPWDAQDPLLGYPKLWGKKLSQTSPKALAELVKYNRKLAHPKHAATAEFAADHGVTGRELRYELQQRNVDVENHLTPADKGRRETRRAKKRKVLKLK